MTNSLLVQPEAVPVAANSHDVHVDSGKLGMWAFIISDTVIFATFLACSSLLRIWNHNWHIPTHTLNLRVAGIMTAFLLASSVTMVSALAALEQENQLRFKRCLLLTILGGSAFLLLQAWEWSHLFHQGLTLTHNPWGAQLFGASFYIVTGFHGVHVIVGVVSLTILLLRGLRGRYHHLNAGSVALAGLYWCFVDVSWLFILLVIYVL